MRERRDRERGLEIGEDRKGRESEGIGEGERVRGGQVLFQMRGTGTRG